MTDPRMTPSRPDPAVPPSGSLPNVRGLELTVRGVVQGVGFRPFVHRLAVRHGLRGWVRNESGTVRLWVEGTPDRLLLFQEEIAREAPPLARIDAVHALERAPTGAADFRIVRSRTAGTGRPPISPDTSVCDACLVELFDPDDRRHRYPFITCAHCGPRFTVVREMPWHRERTTLAAFPPCERCRAEYRDPGNRRHRCETNGCPDCGPSTWLADAAGRTEARGADALAGAGRLLREGGILAVRGLGGFHLAVDAASEAAVARLRARKGRDSKPLAVMVRTVEEAIGLAQVAPREAELLQSGERPIVLLRKRSPSELAPAVAPGLDTVGVMVAYTPLHHLLLDGARRPLVMTRGHVGDEPTATGNDEARERLAAVADAFLLHDREIEARYDDSVVRVAGVHTIVIRRARGFAPLPVSLPVPTPRPLVAVGSRLENTFTLAAGSTAWVSPHMGGLDSVESGRAFRDALGRFRTLFRTDPVVGVRDEHPEHPSSRVAEELGLERVLSVQHHHAHVAAVQAEHGHTGRVLGVAFDGTGLGDDGRVWGGEVLDADLVGFTRLARLRYAPLPGGEQAAASPWRAALGYLSLEPDAAGAFGLALAGVPEDALGAARRQVAHRLNAPEASSMGRLLDAAAAVLGVRQRADYEGQASLELEALAGTRPAGPLPFPVRREAGLRVMDPLPLLRALGEARRKGRPVEELAAALHESVARTTARVVRALAEERGVRVVAVGGGVFQNARLLSTVVERLEDAGLRVLVPSALPPNDGAISYGQAAVAAARLSAEAAPRDTRDGRDP